MIVGVGVDVVDIPRFAETIARTEGLADRLLNHGEQIDDDGRRRSVASLAARFAAKEALAKALGAPAGLEWRDAEVVTGADGRPSLEVRGTVASLAERLGVESWHLSLSHDGDSAMAVVLAEGRRA